MKELQIHVEKTVRPILASAETKLKMREELFTHIGAIYDEERERRPDESAALAETIRRFGAPAELTRELQDSVSRLERWFATYERLYQRRAKESAWRHALRAAGVTLLFVVVLMAFAPPFVAIFRVTMEKPTNWIDSIGFRAFLANAAMLTFGAFMISIIGPHLGRQFETGLFRPRSWFATAGWLVYCMAIFATGGWLFNIILIADFHESWNVLAAWILPIAVAPLMVAVVARLQAIETAKSAPWTSLDISA